MKIYYAAPLFTEASQDYNAKVVKSLRETLGNSVDIYLPQENEALNDKSGFADSITIANGDNSYLLSADLVIAHIDGQEIDAGVASEIGISYHAGIPIIGLYTDIRQTGLHYNPKKIEALEEVAENQFDYKNLYTVGLIKSNGSIVRNIDILIERVKKELDFFKKKYFIKFENKDPEYLISEFIIMKLSELDGNEMVENCCINGKNGPEFYSFCTVREIRQSIGLE